MSWFKRKSPDTKQPDPTTEVSINDFRFCYLYGFTQDPSRSSADLSSFAKLYASVIGDTGGVILPQSLHPYQLINPKGTSVWIAAYGFLFTRKEKDEMLKKMKEENAIFQAGVPSSFNEYHVWPDKRLLPEENKEFGTFAPFIIPFLVHNSSKVLRWDEQIAAGVAGAGHANEYLGEVNAALKFLMADPFFVVGFDEFDDQQPTAMVDHFVNYLSHLRR